MTGGFRISAMSFFPRPDGGEPSSSTRSTRYEWAGTSAGSRPFPIGSSRHLLLHAKNFACCYTEDAILWLRNNDLVACRKYYHELETQRINVPFALIDLAQQRYTFLPLVNSYSYGLALHGRQIELVEHRRDERFRSHGGQQYDLDVLTWYDLRDLDQFDRHYARDAGMKPPAG